MSFTLQGFWCKKLDFGVTKNNLFLFEKREKLCRVSWPGMFALFAWQANRKGSVYQNLRLGRHLLWEISAEKKITI